MMKILGKLRSAATSALNYLTTGPASATLGQAVKNHCLSVSGFASIAYGAYEANHIAGFVVLGLLILVFNERVSS